MEKNVEATPQQLNLDNSADPVNASNNDTTDANAGRNTTKRSQKKSDPVVSKENSKKTSEGAIVENNVEATPQQLKFVGNSVFRESCNIA